MSSKIPLCLLILSVLCATSTAQSSGVPVTKLIVKLSSLWRNDRVNFLGHTCYFSVRPRISRFKLKYRGKMSCPGWVPYTGKGTSSGRSTAIKRAISSFVKKAVAAKDITKAQAQRWL